MKKVIRAGGIYMRSKLIFPLLLLSLISCGKAKEKPNEETAFEKEKNEIINEVLHPKPQDLDSITYYHATSWDGIPDSVWEMKNLKTLSVLGYDGCQPKYDANGKQLSSSIDSISPRIGELENLEELSIVLNGGITELPEEIKNCKKLKKIDLTDCPIQNIDNLTSLENLNELLLYGGYLQDLPKDIGKLKKLKTLGLAGNPLPESEIKRVKKALPNCDIVF